MISSAILARLQGLRHFVEVARQESFRGAADKLNVAPSAVSKQIKNLEENLGVELFSRARGRAGLELTEAGRVLLFRCASVINELNIAREELDQLQGLQLGHLRLGVNEVVATDLLPGMLRNFNRNHPNLQFTIMVENTPVLLSWMRDGDIDIGLGYNVPPSPDIETLSTLYRRVYLVTAPDHRLATRRKVRLGEIAGEKFIFPDPTLALHQMLHDALERGSISVRNVMTTNSFTLLRQMVQNGMGVSVVIGRFLQNKGENIAFIEIDDPAFVQKPLTCCRLAGRAPTASSVAFAAAVRTLFAQYGG
ncbi:LysR family transcriptional regulator [Paracoccus pantotrophus]|uniref:LysR family transcriptional regulator n=1 Tax=Paracoccus pantotrophus TaxID=82367 RepID=A0AAE6NYU5_PARPN|nr:LysR family transcriptional regulator [Paracoccus pantotrophus]QFG37582.1 LysR family transcriptional regulator [Paracoccus pantotrophus]